MSEFIKNHSEGTIKRLLELSQKHARSPSPIPDGIGSQPKGTSWTSDTDQHIEEKEQTYLQVPNTTDMHEGKPVPEPTRTGRNKMATTEMIRSWEEEFDGTGNPAEFISRTEELTEAYGIELDHAAGTMKILLKGCALDGCTPSCESKECGRVLKSLRLFLKVFSIKPEVQPAIRRGALGTRTWTSADGREAVDDIQEQLGNLFPTGLARSGQAGAGRW